MPHSRKVSALDEEKKKCLDQLFEDLPADFEARYQQLMAIRTALQTKIAALLEPTLKAYAQDQTMEGTGIEGRKAFAARLNDMIRDIGLTLITPRNKKPAVLIAELRRLDAPSAGSCFTLLERV